MKPTLWRSTLSCHLQCRHPIGAVVQVLAVRAPLQLLADVQLSLWAHVSNPDKAAGSCLWPVSAWVIVAIWRMNQQMESLISYFCMQRSNFPQHHLLNRMSFLQGTSS